MIDSRSIDDLRVDVRQNVTVWKALCAAEGLNVLITSTLRDDAYQATLYAQGRTKPGQIVTNSPTTTYHGLGLAFDFCKNVKGHEYDDLEFFSKAAKIAQAMGFTWGGSWTSFVDRPHIQWDNYGLYTSSMLRAFKAGNGAKCPDMPLYVQEKPIEEEIMDVKRYNTEADIQAECNWALPTIKKLIDAGALGGSGAKTEDGRPADLNLSVDMLRSFVINDRMGVYDRV